MESSLRKSSNYVLYFDLLNIVACFAVVVLHCSTTYFEFREDTAWYFSAILQMLFHWGSRLFHAHRCHPVELSRTVQHACIL